MMQQPVSNSSMKQMGDHIIAVNEEYERDTANKVAAATSRLMTKEKISPLATLDKFFTAESASVGTAGAKRAKAFESGLQRVNYAAIIGMSEGIRASFTDATLTVNGSKSDRWKLGLAATQAFASGLASPTQIPSAAYSGVLQSMASVQSAKESVAPVQNERTAGLMRRAAKMNALHAKSKNTIKLPLRTTFARESEKVRQWGKNLASAAVLNASLTANSMAQRLSSLGKFFTSKAQDLKTGATEMLHAQAVKRTVKAGAFVAAAAALGALAPHMMTAFPNATEVGHSLAHHGQHAVHAVGDIHHHAHNAVKAVARTGHHLAHSGLRPVIHAGHAHNETVAHVIKAASAVNSDMSADTLNLQQLQHLHDPAKTIAQHAHSLSHPAKDISEHAQNLTHAAKLGAQHPALPTVANASNPSNPVAAQVAQAMRSGATTKLQVPLDQQIMHTAKAKLIDEPTSFFRGMVQGIRDIGSQMSTPQHTGPMVADAGRYAHDYSTISPR